MPSAAVESTANDVTVAKLYAAARPSTSNQQYVCERQCINRTAEHSEWRSPGRRQHLQRQHAGAADDERSARRAERAADNDVNVAAANIASFLVAARHAPARRPRRSHDGAERAPARPRTAAAAHAATVPGAEPAAAGRRDGRQSRIPALGRQPARQRQRSDPSQSSQHYPVFAGQPAVVAAGAGAPAQRRSAHQHGHGAWAAGAAAAAAQGDVGHDGSTAAVQLANTGHGWTAQD